MTITADDGNRFDLPLVPSFIFHLPFAFYVKLNRIGHDAPAKAPTQAQAC
jgi:hypothetical protein